MNKTYHLIVLLGILSGKSLHGGEFFFDKLPDTPTRSVSSIFNMQQFSSITTHITPVAQHIKDIYMRTAKVQSFVVVTVITALVGLCVYDKIKFWWTRKKTINPLFEKYKDEIFAKISNLSEQKKRSDQCFITNDKCFTIKWNAQLQTWSLLVMLSSPTPQVSGTLKDSVLYCN